MPEAPGTRTAKRRRRTDFCQTEITTRFYQTGAMIGVQGFELAAAMTVTCPAKSAARVRRA